MKRVRIAAASPDEAVAVIRAKFLRHFFSVTPLGTNNAPLTAWHIQHPTDSPPPEFSRDASWRNAKPIRTLDFELHVHATFNPTLPTKVWIAYDLPLGDVALELADDCDLIINAGAGMARIDLETARDLGILVTSVPDAASEEIAEVIVHEFQSCLKPKTPKSSTPIRLGLVGLGSIGQAIASLAQKLGWEIWAHDPFKADYFFERNIVRRAPLHELAGICDLLSVQIPLCPDTRGLIGSNYFQFQKPGQIVVNASAPEIVDTTLSARGKIIQPDDTIQSAIRSASARTRALERSLEMAVLFLAGEMPGHLLMDPPLPRSVKS